ncbi:MAG: hypothetical protein HY835_13515 [Anaerolineae bacterium]|nr:hypothetical protein [Anaerolineae bacterium]
MKILKNLLQVLSTGYILVFFSEHLFWARVRPDDSLAGWMGAWIAYSLMAFVFLALLTHFRVKNIWALFLAGAVFGWLGEGLVVQTAYEMLPLSISFTGLAWHALLSVWVGWYAVRQSLHSPDRWAALKLAAVIGLGYGLWAICWWLEPDGGFAPVADFAVFSLTTTLLVIVAYVLADWSATEPFSPSRRVTGVVAGVFALYFGFITVPAAPSAVVVLPILLGLAFWGLFKNRQVEAEGSLPDVLQGPVAPWKYACLLALPAVGILVYALAAALGLQWRTNWALYLITTPLGFVLFGYSLFRLLRRKATSPG